MFDAASAIERIQHKASIEIEDHQDRLNISNRVRTSVLPWRGQFSPQLVEFLIEKYALNDGLVVDPFCGSGTVLYEAALKQRDAFGVDINPAAIYLARISSVLSETEKTRKELLNSIDNLSNTTISMCQDSEGICDLSSIANYISLQKKSVVEKTVLEAFFLQMAGNFDHIKAKRVINAQRYFHQLILDLPKYDGRISTSICDSRKLSLDNNSAGYIITSPPYINVFNYHQNYRPAIEALGWNPLPIARSEMGANRKHRQNRFLTVIQYCMDMSQFLVESNRILRSDGVITLVLGRESNVLGVAFKNSDLIVAVAAEGMGAKIVDWQERHFINRFGKTIYEDIITLTLATCNEKKAIEIGRSVGIQALKLALKTCPPDRSNNLEEAIFKAYQVEPSPIMEVKD